MKYKNPAATIDVIVERDGEVLLVKRKHEPFQDKWALPGGFLECGKETLERTCVRELGEETGLVVEEEDLMLLDVYSEPDRDPRGHVISHTYVAGKFMGRLRPGDDAAEAKFFHLNALPELAFDHEKIIKDYIARRKNV